MTSVARSANFNPTVFNLNILDSAKKKSEVQDEELQSLLAKNARVEDIYTALKKRKLELSKLQKQLEIKQSQNNKTLAPQNRQKNASNIKHLLKNISQLENEIAKLNQPYLTKSLKNILKRLESTYEKFSSQPEIEPTFIERIKHNLKAIQSVLIKLKNNNFTRTKTDLLTQKFLLHQSKCLNAILHLTPPLWSDENQELIETLNQEKSELIQIQLNIQNQFKLIALAFEKLLSIEPEIKHVKITPEKPQRALKKANNIHHQRTQIFNLRKVLSKTTDRDKQEELKRKIKSLETSLSSKKTVNLKSIIETSLNSLKKLFEKLKPLKERLEKVNFLKMLDMILREMKRYQDSLIKEMSHLQKVIPPHPEIDLLRQFFQIQQNKISRFGVDDFTHFFDEAQKKETVMLNNLPGSLTDESELLINICNQVNQTLIKLEEMNKFSHFKSSMLLETEKTKRLSSQEMKIKKAERKIDQLIHQLDHSMSPEETKKLMNELNEQQILLLQFVSNT